VYHKLWVSAIVERTCREDIERGKPFLRKEKRNRKKKGRKETKNTPKKKSFFFPHKGFLQVFPYLRF
jgi:hypothetical protein